MSTSVSRSSVAKKTPERQPAPAKEQEAGKAGGAAKVEAVAKKGKPPKPFRAPNLYLRLVIAGVLGLILVVMAFFSAGQLKGLVGEIERKRGQMVALQEKEGNLRILSSALGSVRREAALIEEALPTEEGVVDFIKEMGSLGREVNLEVFNFETDKPRLDSAGNSYIEWTVEATGSLPKLEKFLEKLLDLPILIRPKVIDLDKMNEDASKLILKAWLYVETDFFVKGK